MTFDRLSIASARSLARRAAALVVALLVAAALSGCGTISYLTQAGLGQIDIMTRARPLASVTRDPATPERLRALLAHVATIKRFGERNGLRATASYEQFAELQRPAAVWVVSASEPLRLHSRSWWFPIVGSITYLGWFHHDDADDFAAELREDGWDVDVREASAYSTLGWFDDPVLSTMIPEGDEALGELAEVVLHESLHATLYVDGQSFFNEGVAEFVGRRLASAYLDKQVGEASREKAAYLEAIDAVDERERALRAARARLEQLYASPRPDGEKLAAKRAILEELREELGFRRPINNATLAQVETYSAASGDLDALLRACGGSFPRLIASLRRIGGGAFAEQQERDPGRAIRPLTTAGCPAGHVAARGR